VKRVFEEMAIKGEGDVRPSFATMRKRVGDSRPPPMAARQPEPDSLLPFLQP